MNVPVVSSEKSDVCCRSGKTVPGREPHENNPLSMFMPGRPYERLSVDPIDDIVEAKGGRARRTGESEFRILRGGGRNAASETGESAQSSPGLCRLARTER